LVDRTEHGINPIAEGDTSMKLDGLPAAFDGHYATCGCTLVSCQKTATVSWLIGMDSLNQREADKSAVDAVWQSGQLRRPSLSMSHCSTNAWAWREVIGGTFRFRASSATDVFALFHPTPRYS